MQMDLRVGGPSCKRPAADESPDIGAVHYCFRFSAPFLNQSTHKASVVENQGKISYLLTPVKSRGGLGSKHRHTFFPVGIDGCVTRWTAG